MSAASPLGPGGQPLTQGMLPPGVFDPKLDNCDFCAYTLDLGNSPKPNGAGANLAAGATASAFFMVERNVDFYLTSLEASATINGQDGIFYYNYQSTIQIEDSGTVRQFFSAPTPVETMTGIADSGRLILPRLIRALSKVTTTITNNSTSATYNHFWIVFVGYRIYLGN